MSRRYEYEIAFVVDINAYGLMQDVRLLQERLESIGMASSVLHRRSRTYQDFLCNRKVADILIHLERIRGLWLNAADRHWLFPNQEFFKKIYVHRLRYVDRIFAKTRHAKEIFSRYNPRCTYTGFTSQDRKMPGVDRKWKRFLHAAGNSKHKGTEMVIDLWSRHPEWPELVLVRSEKKAPLSVPSNITLMRGYLDDNEMKRIQNSCGIHLCPSKAEGWGHYILEGMSCGAVVVTTNAPPMTELVGAGEGLVVPWRGSRPENLGHEYFADPEALESIIEDLLERSEESLQGISIAARRKFEAIDRDFEIEMDRIFRQCLESRR
ncbi:MAG: glycosyltransferase family 4 protein [Ectothiorhodospiraceae bacterium AqS1]|nr:glycosyltransferase family 4 protein [Ectothiorhodospiraceae bacterium AqS1]